MILLMVLIALARQLTSVGVTKVLRGLSVRVSVLRRRLEMAGLLPIVGARIDESSKNPVKGVLHSIEDDLDVLWPHPDTWNEALSTIETFTVPDRKEES